MRRKKILSLDDITLDQMVKIQGTEYDRKRKLTDKDIKYIKKLIDKGVSISEIADSYGVVPATIKYNVFEDYRNYIREHATGRHTGVTHKDFADRIAYKRELIKSRCIKVKN